MIANKQKITGNIAAKQSICGAISSKGKLTGSVSVGTAIKIEPEQYEGVYEIMPTEEEQVLETKDKLLKENVVVAAIPKEYGRVTYNQDKTITIT